MESVEENYTEEQKQFLEECILEFSDKFTDADPDYKKVWENDLPPPPVCYPWYGGFRRNQQNPNRHNSYQRNYRDRRYNNERRDDYDHRGYKDDDRPNYSRYDYKDRSKNQYRPY